MELIPSFPKTLRLVYVRKIIYLADRAREGLGDGNAIAPYWKDCLSRQCAGRKRVCAQLRNDCPVGYGRRRQSSMYVQWFTRTILQQTCAVAPSRKRSRTLSTHGGQPF